MKKHLLLCIVLTFLCVQFLSAQDHHWPLTTDLNDVVGDLHGTNNGVTFENDAVRGPVAYFDGNGYANLPSFVKDLTEITIACWFRMDSSRVWARIYSFGRGDASEPKDVMMLIPVSGNANNEYRFTLKPLGDEWYDIDFPKEIVDIQLNTWYHSVIVLKPDSIIVYHDGEQVFAESGYPNPFGTIDDTENALGKSFWPADPLWKGALSDLRVYNTALSASEVADLYEETMAAAAAPDPDHHWPLKADLNDIVGDLHGTNNGVTFENDAVRGPVAYFDGNVYANLPSFVKDLTEISIACWFRMDSSRVWARIYSFGRGDASEPKDVMMLIPVSGNANNEYRFTLKPLGDEWYDIDFPKEIVDIQLNTWYFSGIVLKPDSIIVYHNDQQVFAESGYPNAFGTIDDTENALGKSFWPADPLWKGALSDLRVYNTALSEAEMIAVYNQTSVITGINDVVAMGDAPTIYSYFDRIVVRLNKPAVDEIVSVYSITGALLTKKPVYEISQVSFKTGIYIVRVKGSNTSHVTKVFVE